MPELPEVEYVARQLREELIGHVFVRVQVEWARSVQGMDSREFEERVRGRQVTGIGRRAKYLLIDLDDDFTLIVHRRMSGNLLLTPAGDDEPYVRVAFELDDGRRLLYTDPRKFGRLTLVATSDLATFFAALGPEPLEPTFTIDALRERLGTRAQALKATLLDQTVVAGLGNIYADEALFRAGLRPTRTARSLTPQEIAALHAGIQGALQTGIEHGGTTFGRHRDVHNEVGRNLEHVEVYRRAGLPCLRCGGSIERITIAQRSTHFCSTCQK